LNSQSLIGTLIENYTLTPEEQATWDYDLAFLKSQAACIEYIRTRAIQRHHYYNILKAISEHHVPGHEDSDRWYEISFVGQSRRTGNFSWQLDDHEWQNGIDSMLEYLRSKNLLQDNILEGKRNV